MRLPRCIGLMVVVWTGAWSLGWGAPPRVTGVKPVPRAILKLDWEYVAPLTGDAAVIHKGVVVDVTLLNGKRYAGLEVADIQPAKGEHTFRGLSFVPAKDKPSRLQPSALYQIRVAERVFDVVVEPSTKAYLLLDLTKRSERAEARLTARGHRVWSEPTPAETAAALQRFEELYARAQAAFPNSKFSRTETRYFLFYTDLPAQQVSGYIANLDAMYDQLCTLFGIPPGTNIWVGKCPIFAFLERSAFVRFEAEFLQHQPAEDVAGLNHQDSRGHVITTCVRGSDPVFFAVVLVHETAHGFVHRLRSTGRMPPWMNEGLADWVAQVVVPQSDHVANRLAEALPRLRGTGSLGGDFLDDEGRIERWQYGVAASLTQFLLTTDANAYRGLITGIKEGHPWREALELTYGVTAEELVAAYGRAIGIPGLRP
uniref:DUF1570 domain-containing protein n=1 Tax=Schlesneria paludicola TaxID=360056 RepID=A0A7C4QMR9_9PLAN